MKNIPEDLNAWIRRIKDPIITLDFSFRLKNITEKAMWPTEEKAITFFKSVRNKHVAPTNIIPTNLTKMNKLVDLNSLKNNLKRNKPIPPNFKRIPARIIEP